MDSSALPIPQVKPVLDFGTSRHKLEEEVVALFDQFRSPLLRYLSTFGIALHDAEEVVQEVFLSLFQHLRAGKSRENLRAWLFRVTHNLALKQRYQARRDLGATSDLNVPQELVADSAPNPEQRLVAVSTQLRLLAVVRALPESDRRCLSLRAEGLRYREISQILDISLGAVSLSLARSLARIARAVER